MAREMWGPRRRRCVARRWKTTALRGLRVATAQAMGIRRPEDMPGLTPPQMQALRLRLYRYRNGL